MAKTTIPKKVARKNSPLTTLFSNSRLLIYFSPRYLLLPALIFSLTYIIRGLVQKQRLNLLYDVSFSDAVSLAELAHTVGKQYWNNIDFI